MPGIPHRIERIASDSTANDIGYPQDSPLTSKKLSRTIRGTHGTRMAHSTKHLHDRIHGGGVYHAAGKSQIRAEANEAKLASEPEIQGNGVVSMSVSYRLQAVGHANSYCSFRTFLRQRVSWPSICRLPLRMSPPGMVYCTRRGLNRH